MSMIGSFARMSSVLAERLVSDSAERSVFFEQGERHVSEAMDVDKAWHAIHFALTGQAWPDESPLAQAIFGGEPFGDDFGYGPPRLLAASKVQSIALALVAVDPSDAAKELDIGRLDDEDIYPGSWSNDERASRDYIAYHLQRLRDFYKEAASQNEAVILWMS